MKRNGCAMAGCIIEIIAGAMWLWVALFVNKVAEMVNVDLNILQIILPLAVLLGGIIGLSPRAKTSSYKTNAVTNLGLVAVQYFFGSYIGLGYLQMILLITASIFLFFGKITLTTND